MAEKKYRFIGQKTFDMLIYNITYQNQSSSLKVLRLNVTL